MCSKHNAVIQIQQVINNQKRTIRLCEKCARALGIVKAADNESLDATIQNLFSGLFGDEKREHDVHNRKCPVCGTTSKSIAKTNMAGCTECYTVFSAYIRKSIRKTYGNARHEGKFPRRYLGYRQFLFEINDLKKQLRSALGQEDYEKAALLRDRIKTIKQSGW